MLILDWNNKVSLELAADALVHNNVLIGTSDTVLGLLAPATPAGALQLDALKERRDKPYILLVGGVAQVAQLIEKATFDRLERLIAQCWPGPVTIICRAQTDAPAHLATPERTVGIRIPAHSGLQHLLHKLPGLFSTSANISGQPVPQYIQEVDEQILAGVYATIVEKDKKPTIQPSTILDATTATIRLVRAGVVPVEQLEAWYGRPFIR